MSSVESNVSERYAQGAQQRVEALCCPVDYDPGLLKILPSEIIERYHLPSLRTALIWIHTPMKEQDSVSARKRFAFEEVFFIQVAKQKERKIHDEQPSFKINIDQKSLSSFVKRFPFALTNAQNKAIEDILKDMADAISNAVKEGTGDIKAFAKEILDSEKESLKELGEAKLRGDINQEVFDREIEREKKVVEAELLTIKIMTKALAQKAVNAAIEVFVKAVKAAI